MIRTIAALIFCGTSMSAHAEDVEALKARIWAKEQMIYAGRARGDLGPYIANASPNYAAFSPKGPAAHGTAGLERLQQALGGKSDEKLTMELKDFTTEGDTAVIYYVTHRTQRPDGTAVDEHYENIHVWVRAGDDWRLIATMPRPYKP
ncbi:MAG: nuclear transport factor 2 family protein [Alphaproteobacteria bacterium]|nr:nuclear transport factor 2 family protein [Alphaproteobacteria bacterium]